MRNEAVAALLVGAIILGAAAGYVAGFENAPRASASISRNCVQTGIHGSLFVRVVGGGSEVPISGAPVQATILNYCSPSYEVSLGVTNGSGYTPASLNWTGVFLINVTYPVATPHSSATTYEFLSQTSGAVSLATLDISSGEVIETPIACNGLGCSNSTTTSVAYILG